MRTVTIININYGGRWFINDCSYEEKPAERRDFTMRSLPSWSSYSWLYLHGGAKELSQHQPGNGIPQSFSSHQAWQNKKNILRGSYRPFWRSVYAAFSFYLWFLRMSPWSSLLSGFFPISTVEQELWRRDYGVQRCFSRHMQKMYGKDLSRLPHQDRQKQKNNRRNKFIIDFYAEIL